MLAKLPTLNDAGGPLLFVAGAAMVVGGALEDTTEVALALVGFGAALLAIGALLPRLVGPFKLSAGGLEAELREAVEQAAEKQHVPAEERAALVEHVVEAVRSDPDAIFREWMQDLMRHSAREAARDEADRRARRRELIDQLAEQYVEREQKGSLPYTRSRGERSG